MYSINDKNSTWSCSLISIWSFPACIYRVGRPERSHHMWWCDVTIGKLTSCGSLEALPCNVLIVQELETRTFARQHQLSTFSAHSGVITVGHMCLYLQFTWRHYTDDAFPLIFAYCKQSKTGAGKPRKQGYIKNVLFHCVWLIPKHTSWCNSVLR